MKLGRSRAVTDPGRKRRKNEDAYVEQPPLFAIADGMGGAQAGEIASRLAAAALVDEREAASVGNAEGRLVALIQGANQRIYQRSSQDAATSGMGTTMTAALVEDGIVSFGHVGDSRAYLIRNGTLDQLTEDHSLVAELLRSGKLSPEEAEVHPQRSVITRALGTDPDVDVDTFSIAACPGDIYLLCSDGLTDMVDDETILRTVEENRDDLDAAARALIARANRAGGEDNITIVFFEIADDASGREDATLRVPAAATAPAADDEDTLSPLDAVPTLAVDARGDPRAAAGAESGSPAGRLLVTVGLGALLALLLVLLVLGFAR